MSKINWNQIGKAASIFWKDHGTTILTVISATTAIVSPILAVRATPKAMEILEERKKELEVEKLPALEVVKSCWKVYLPAAAATAVSVGCSVGAQASNMKQNVALLAAAKLSDEAFTLYKSKVVETLGENKEKQIRDETHKEMLEKTPKAQSNVILMEKGETLFFDSVSKRYFRSDIHKVKSAKDEINRRMTFNGYISLADFYDEVGLERTGYSEEIGWNLQDGLVDIYFGAQLSDDETPCIVLDYRSYPKYNFDRY